MNISPARQIPILWVGGTEFQRELAGKFALQIELLARTESQRWLGADESEPAAAAAIVGEMKVLIPLAGLIDVGSEKARLAREIKRVEGEIAKCKAKLSNANFVQNAPAEVVAQEQQRLKDFETTLAALNEQLDRLSDL